MSLELNRVGVLALGNLLCRDEGVGIHLLRALKDCLPPEVEMLDGGTSGLNLLNFIEEKKYLIILDAVDSGGKPGEVVEWREDHVPRYCSGKLSLHQMSFAEVLYWAHFTGNFPDRIMVIGVQPENMSRGLELSSTAQASIPAAKDRVLACLADWGVICPAEQQTYA